MIASDVGGIPEMISDPSLGMLVPPGDPIALGDAMARTLMLTGDQMTRHLERARQHVADHFDVHAQSMKIAALLER